MNKLLIVVLLLMCGCTNPFDKKDSETGLKYRDEKLATLENGCEVHLIKVYGYHEFQTVICE
jgi:hypothetical protein